MWRDYLYPVYQYDLRVSKYYRLNLAMAYGDNDS